MRYKILFFELLMIFIVFFSTCSFEHPKTNCQPITRAAFDLGSGSFKLAVAEVCGHHVQLKYAKFIQVGLGFDLAGSTSGKLSEKIQYKALNALKELVNDAKENGAKQFVGVATATFRQACNGKEVLQKLKEETGIDLHLISQEEEGILAFKTVINSFPEISEEECIALDVGTASFQLTGKNSESYDVLHGPLGVSGVLKIYSEEIKNVPYRRGLLFSPITSSAIDLLVEKIKSKIFSPSWIKTKLSDQTVKVLYLYDWVDEIQQYMGKRKSFLNKTFGKLCTKLSIPRMIHWF